MTAQTELPQMPSTKVVQITNIAPQATKDQMQTLFGFLGKIEDIRLYPTIRDVSVPIQFRICYVKFYDAVCVGVAQHMTNTVFIDRALIVTPYVSSTNEIPDEYRALEIAAQANVVPGLYSNNSKLPPHVTNQIEGTQRNQVITTHDPVLISNGLPPYPPLPINYDSVRIEEIRRTILASNIDSNISAQQLIDFFGTAGDVKYVRFCKRDNDPNKYALIEFSEQSSIIPALKMNGSDLLGRPVQISHSTVNIDKPQAKSNETAQREIEEAMTSVKRAQDLISAAIDPVIGILSKDKKKRSRSRSRRRSRSRSKGRRRRSRSRSRGRRKRRSRSRKRSRSRDRKKRSRDRRRTKSRSRSKSRGRSRKSKSRSRSKRSEKTKSGRHKEDRKERDKDKESRNKESPIKTVNKDSVKSSVEIDDHNKEQLRDVSKSPEKRSPSAVRRSRSRSRRDSRSTSGKRTPPTKKSRSPSRIKSRSLSRTKSRSVSRKKSRSPSRKKSRSPSRKKSRSPPRKKSRSPTRRTRSPRRRSRSRSKRKSRTPIRKRSRTPRKKRSRTPRRKRSRTPAKWRSRSPSSPPRLSTKSPSP